MSAKTLFVTVAEEYKDDPSVDSFIAIAEMQIGVNFGGDARQLLVAYLAAHLLTLAKRKYGATGDIATIKEGALGLGYVNNSTKTRNGLSNTSYGQLFNFISRGFTFGATTRVQNV